MKRFALALNIFLATFLATNTVLPCTTFVLQGGGRIYLGRNLDWDWENGLIIVNQRNVNKTGFVQPGSTPIRWTSKYGSVTFNQFGQDLPFGGMNETGLVIENMWLSDTRYPEPDSRPAINILQWIQYQLDNCRTVDEVIATDAALRLEKPPFTAWIHYLVCDSKGDCASIECLEGKLVVHRGKDFPLHALANDTYEHAITYARLHPVPGTNTAGLVNPGSDPRFCRAAARAQRFESSDPKADVKYAFDTLEQVRQGDFTVWRIVYDISARQIHCRTRSNPQERTLDLKALDFACGHPVQFVDIQANPASGGLPFKDLTEASHRQYLQAFAAQPSLKQQFGDLSLQMEGLLLTLRTYSCADQKSR
jgi:penicillin V acylase-like amidase (Ntn superfamily)